MGVLHGSTWRTLRVPDQRLEDLVILDVMNDLILPQERYPEIFMLIPLLEVCQEGASRRAVLGGRLGLLSRDLEDRVNQDVINDLV